VCSSDLQNWRDALVAATSASTSAVTVTFNWGVIPAQRRIMGTKSFASQSE
jgi:hypothetical protein